MNKTEMIKLARELYSIHGLRPVPVAGKVPLGGKGWNIASIEVRLRNIAAPECTGVGIQMGLVWHPVLGPVEARALDIDIDDEEKRNIFADGMRRCFQLTQWRWGRRPATIIFTQPGVIKREKYGPIQLLGEGKQVVYFGEYRNKLPLVSDPAEYWHQGPSIFDLQPPYVDAQVLDKELASFFPTKLDNIISAPPLTTGDLAALSAENMRWLRDKEQGLLTDADNSPTGSGRGTKYYSVGLKYGALIKASGTAPLLVDAAQRVCPTFVPYQFYDHPILAEIGKKAEETFLSLPGSLDHGDKRDFARGVGASMGLSQTVDVMKARQPLPMPSGRNYPAQTLEALLLENIQPQKFLINRFLPESGCIVLAGKPKIGKGWIVLELGLSVAEGSKFWGEQCEQGEVLMYMLEDGKRRITERVKILRSLDYGPAVKNMRFRYSIDGPFFVNADGAGSLLDDIREQVRLFPHIRLIIVDVLQRIRGEQNRADNSYQADYKVVGAIQKLATEFNVLILVVHHTKKGKVDDAIDSISGSFGVIGAADGGIIIGKEGDIVKVESRMRDIPNFEFEMFKEGDSPMWKPAQTLAELMMPSEGTKARQVVEALHTAACCLTAGDIAARTGISEKNVATYLMRMMKSNQVTRPSRGFYMATGLQYRERIQGVIDLLKHVPKVKATDEVKAQYAPNGVPPEVSYMILTPVAIKEIEASFVNGKDCLNSLRLRGLAIYNSDTVWLIGSNWGEAKSQIKPVPFTFKMPWEQ